MVERTLICVLLCGTQVYLQLVCEKWRFCAFSLSLQNKMCLSTRGVTNVVKCRPGTGTEPERVPGYQFARYHTVNDTSTPCIAVPTTSIRQVV